MYILHEDADRVVIATTKSSNEKTGNMVQVWILCRNESPVEAAKSGADIAVCGDCPQRHFLGGGCYVTLFQGPLSIWKAYKRGSYKHLSLDQYAKAFAGRAIRLGAYGDPAYIPVPIIDALAAAGIGHTSYTHQWKWVGQQAVSLASVDNITEYEAAKALGYRTFRVSSAPDVQPGEIICPASDEGGNKTNCIDCLLCNGAGKAKNILIVVHGALKNRFEFDA